MEDWLWGFSFGFVTIGVGVLIYLLINPAPVGSDEDGWEDKL